MAIALVISLIRPIGTDRKEKKLPRLIGGFCFEYYDLRYFCSSLTLSVFSQLNPGRPK